MRIDCRKKADLHIYSVVITAVTKTKASLLWLLSDVDNNWRIAWSLWQTYGGVLTSFIAATFLMHFLHNIYVTLHYFQFWSVLLFAHYETLLRDNITIIFTKLQLFVLLLYAGLSTARQFTDLRFVRSGAYIVNKFVTLRESWGSCWGNGLRLWMLLKWIFLL